MIKGVIFDLDGTTVYTLQDLCDALNIALKSFSFPEVDLETVRKGLGNGAMRLIRAVAPKDIDDETAEKLCRKYLDTYINICTDKSIPYPGVSELLRKLQDRGVKIVINSNKGDNLSKKIIAYDFPDINFVDVYGDREGVIKKPDPKGANDLVEMMKLNKSEVLYVGDSEVDVKTARNANLKSVGCLWGYRDYETLKEAGADYIIERPQEILSLLEEL